jgi:predicted DNA repair protein MutK
MVGGAFLCYEGFEKIAHRFLHGKTDGVTHHKELVQAIADPAVDLVAFERDKIKGAVRTDFILSAEIVAITLGTVAASPFTTQVAVLSGIAILMTVGVYGLVAGIVKLDDAGLHLSRKEGEIARALGAAILRVAPWLMKALSVAGTAAMFLVGGGILVHGIPVLHHLVENAGMLASLALDAVAGIVAGALALAGVTLVQKMRKL